MKKTFETHDGFLLEEGKRYLWSGISMSKQFYAWSRFRCEIKKIEEDRIIVYDLENKRGYICTNDDLIRMKVVFNNI